MAGTVAGRSDAEIIGVTIAQLIALTIEAFVYLMFLSIAIKNFRNGVADSASVKTILLLGIHIAFFILLQGFLYVPALMIALQG